MGLTLGGPKRVPPPPPAPAAAVAPPTEIDDAAADLWELLSDGVRALGTADQLALVNAFQSNQPLQSAPPAVQLLITGVVKDFLE